MTKMTTRTKRGAWWSVAAWLAVAGCGGAPEAAPVPAATRAAEPETQLELTVLDEVTVEGEPARASSALDDARIELTAPFLDVKAVTTSSDGRTETYLVVRTADGWVQVDAPLLVAWDDDPGCPSVERESTIAEVRVERGVLVVVTTADRDWYADARSGFVQLTKARACRLADGAVTCSDAETVAASLSSHADGDDTPDMPEAAQTFSTRWWVDADGELELAETYDDASAFPR